MIKIIIIADFLIDYITKEIYLFAKELEKNYDWNLIHLSNLNIDSLIKQKSIILCITYDWLDLTKLKHENIKIIYKIDDLHNPNKIRINNVNCCDIIISPYVYLFTNINIKNLYSNINNKPSIFIPYSAVNDFFLPINFNYIPFEKVFISGADNKMTYPFRNYIKYDKKLKDYIDYLDHPSYKNLTHNIINENYYKKLNNYLCCFVDASIYNYLLLKVFEICSVGSLLLIDDTIKTTLNELHFLDNINCIMCNKNNIYEKIKFILDKNNRQEVDKIRFAGMNLVREKHSLNNRIIMFNSGIIKYFNI